MKLTHVFFTTILICIIVAVFGKWFLNQEIIGGDWSYYYNEMLKEFTFFPLSWNPGNGNGLGGIEPLYFLKIFSNFTIVLSTFSGLPWVVVYKIFWFGLFIALSILSSTILIKSTLSSVKYWQLVIGGVIFASNTYILMITGGGQMGIALAYAIAPLVLARFIPLVQNLHAHWTINLRNSLIASLVLAAQLMFDVRIACLTLIAVSVYYVFCIKYYAPKKNILNTFYLLLNTAIPLGIAVLLHASWILPIFFLQSNPIPQGITNVDGFRFFSFADFSHTFSLLHPNWPENIFGKTYFLKPEFLLLPILAFSSLLFISKIKDQKLKIHILFFAFLGLLGAFFAKGVNPPFGEINQWLFIHIPGMNLFRDSTKFYLLITLSYSVLIPFSLLQISRKVLSIKYQVLGKKINMHNTYYIIPATFLLFWLFLIRPAILGQLGGTFQKREVPKEYVVLKDFLHDQPEFFRTLWIPRGVRFNYFSNKHLVVASELLFGTRDITKVYEKLHSTETKIYLQALGIKYIVVPFDPLGEIFVKNRKYDEEQYKGTIERLETLPWLKRLNGFGRIAVFEVSHPKDRFWLSGNGKISYTMINPVDYDLTISTTEPQSLIFSENYNSSWIAQSDGFNVTSGKASMGLNSFFFDKAGNYHIKVIFEQERYFRYGWVIALSTLSIVIFAIFALKHKKV